MDLTIVVPAISAMFLITFISVFLYSFFRPWYAESVIIEDESQLKDIVSKHSEELEIHNVRNLEKDYAKIIYIVHCKRNLRKFRQLNESSREVSKIEYYTKL